MNKETYNKVKNYTNIPFELLQAFDDAVNKQELITTEQYDADPSSGDLVLSRVTKTKKARPVRDILNMYQTLYPQYFDELTYKKAKLLTQDSNKSDDDFLKEVQDAFK